MTEILTIQFTEELLDLIENSGNETDKDVLNALQQLLREAGVRTFPGTEELNIEDNEVLEAPFKIVTKKLVEIPLRKEFRLNGFKPESRTRYRFAIAKVNVPEAEASQWASFFGCIKASTLLTAWLTTILIAGGPITWVMLVSWIVINAVVCFVAIFNQEFLESSDGDVEVGERWGAWG